MRKSDFGDVNKEKHKLQWAINRKMMINFIKKITISLKQTVRNSLPISERRSYGKNPGAHWVTKPKSKRSK